MTLVFTLAMALVLGSISYRPQIDLHIIFSLSPQTYHHKPHSSTQTFDQENLTIYFLVFYTQSSPYANRQASLAY